MKRISVDIGGTFTDCFCVWGDDYVQAKALTTHHNLAQGFNEALDQACSTLAVQRADVLAQVDSVRYATTLGTNALIERKGPRIGRQRLMICALPASSASASAGSRSRTRCGPDLAV